MNITWPTFDVAFKSFGSEDQSVTEFIDVVTYNWQAPTIHFDEDYYNLLIYKRFTTTDESIFYTNLAKEAGKELKVYVYDEPVIILGYGRSPLIFDFIKVVGKPDLLVSHNSFEFGGRIAKKYECDLMVVNDNSKAEPRNDIGLFYIINKDIEPRFMWIDNKNLKTKMSEIIPYIKNRMDVFDAIKGAIAVRVKNKKVVLSLDKSKYNILVMCATQKTIEKQEYKRIIRAVLGDVHLDNTEVYFCGYEISDESYPHINACDVKNISLLDNEHGFDLLVSEHCGYHIIRDNLALLYSMLNDDGGLITPDYYDRINGVNRYFNKFLTKNKYTLAFKNENI